MMHKNQAALFAAVAGVVGISGVAFAAPSKAGATVVNPYTLVSVPVSAPVVTVPAATIVVSPAAGTMSGLAPTKGGGSTPGGGIVTAPPPSGGPTPPVPPGPATR